MKKFFCILLVVVVIVGLYGLMKPLPDGMNVSGVEYTIPSSSIHFFSDLTFVNAEKERRYEQHIFDEVHRMIDNANSYILLDLFLFNDFIGVATTSLRQLSQELTNKLIEKKKINPAITIQLITDPINEFYGGSKFHQFTYLKDSGIEVITTDLRQLRDSNPIYSSFWRAFLQWFGNNYREGILPNILDGNGQKLSFRSYFSMLNYKANHRKIIMTDYIRDNKRGFSVLITSANPHDGSSAHSNSAVRIDDFLWQDILITERAVANFSKKTFIMPSENLISNISDEHGDVVVQLITERAIRDAVVLRINNLKKNDDLDMAMFYIADRKVIHALKEADRRGVNIRLLLDANKDAFGREKNGIPNRQVASELYNYTNGNTKIRWCDTHGEQCHSKLILFTSSEKYEMIIGSANLTRRNIGGFNLETNVYIKSSEKIKAINDAQNFFDKTWKNEGGFSYSLDYSFYKDNSIFKKILYRTKEFLGMSRW